MSKTFVVLLLLGLLSVSWAYSIAKVRVAAPEGWTRVRRASPSQVLKFRFALKQSNLDVLDAMLMDISNPDSPNYAKWMAKDRVLDLVAPAMEDTLAVAKWLIASGAQNVDWSGRDVVKAEAPVSTIEAMFGVQMHEFRHTSGKQLTRHVGSLAVPAHLAHVVDFISGLTELWEPSHNKVHSKTASMKRNDVSEGYVIPEYIRMLYGIPKSWTPNSKSSICVAEFQDDQSYSSDDNTYFNQQMGENVQVSKNVGPFDPSQPDGESTLDVQYAFSIGSNVTSWFWTVDGWMYEFATDLFNTPTPPLVVSMSWGWPEPRQCEIATCSDSQQYVQRTNAEFLKITSTGVTLLASSGDQGAPGDTNPNCDNTDTPISNIFPGGSPYVTSVGATMINPSGSVQNPPPSYSSPVCQTWQCPAIFSEVPCSYPGALITTGGGFSSYVARPSWQNDAVSAYLKSGVTLPPASAFNSANRAFPDVSALGHAYLIAITGSLEQVDGTSCSSPVMGGIVSMLNSWRFNNNKKPLGFINPLLYKAWSSNKAIFNDQTTGNNYCTESCCATYGFNAAKGWDPVTGLGTPNWGPLLAFVQSLPN